MAPVKLPQYVMLKSDNGNYFSLQYPYLCANSSSRDLSASHEVHPVPGQENVIMLQCLENQKFWRRDPDWIKADVSPKPSASQTECLFKVSQLSPKKIDLYCLANKHYLKRFTHEGKTSALNARGGNPSLDITIQMEVSEALSTRRVFDVEYLMDQMQTTDLKPLVLGSATAKNNTSSKTDLAVTVTYAVEETHSWNNSTTLTTGLSVTVSAGIPSIGSVDSTVSTEYSSTTEMGKANSKTSTVSSTNTVKDVNPGVQVTVRVSGTQATGTVPYKYKYQDTRVDGLVLPVETGVDGIFKGVQVINIQWEANETTGVAQALVDTVSGVAGDVGTGVKKLTGGLL